MEEISYEYLRFVQFEEVLQWDAKRYIAVKTKSKYGFYPVFQIVERYRETISILDDEQYKRIKIKQNGKGCELRDLEFGKNIGTKQQFKVKKGQLVFSKIDARNGAFAVIPEELDNGIITNSFSTYDIRNSIVNHQYLFLITSSKFFQEKCEKTSSGTTGRRNISDEIFENIQIPLPTLSEQEAIVAAYNAKIAQAAALESQATVTESEIERYLLEELGVENTTTQTTLTANNDYRFLRFVGFKEVDEWGVDKITNSNIHILKSSKYNNVILGERVQINPSTSFQTIDNETEISFIPMECISDKNGEWEEKRIGKKCYSAGYTKFQNGDLIWARITPCMQNGKSAILNDLVNGYGYGSTEYHIIRNTNSEINTIYIHNLLRLPLLLKNAMTAFTGSAGQQRVPKSYLEKLQIPLPPLSVQNAIVEHINTLKEQIKTCKTQAAALRTQALEDFEKEIFE